MTGCTDPLPTTLTTESIGSFTRPVYVAQPPGSTDLYVVESGGRVRIVRGGTVLPTAYLDISARLGGVPSGENEWGLLSIAFHPDYETNGRAFVGYTSVASTTTEAANRVAEIQRSASDPDRADFVADIIDHPDTRPNHNGGLVMFGPDGYLYAGIGDGGEQGDPFERAQDLSTLFGKILRLDVSTPGVAAVPPSNPFVGVAGAEEEIWAYGLRNPWRFSFDRDTGDFWLGDVGQSAYEEVDYVAASTPAGVNFGWSRYEGTHDFEPTHLLRDGSTHHPPIVDYSHDFGISVVGGYVYHGTAIPQLRGAYVYADAYDSWVRAIRVCGGAITAGPTVIEGVAASSGGAGLVSFGQDNDGELYVVFLSGQVERIIAP